MTRDLPLRSSLGVATPHGWNQPWKNLRRSCRRTAGCSGPSLAQQIHHDVSYVARRKKRAKNRQGGSPVKRTVVRLTLNSEKYTVLEVTNSDVVVTVVVVVVDV